MPPRVRRSTISRYTRLPPRYTFRNTYWSLEMTVAMPTDIGRLKIARHGTTPGAQFIGAAGGRRFRVRPPVDRRGHHAERRVQRAVSVASCRCVPASRSPVRVDPRPVPAMGRAGRLHGRATTAAPRAGCAASRSTATPPARPTSSASRWGTRGPTTTGAARSRRPSGLRLARGPCR